jgi:chromosome segregation ATPase
VEQLRDQLERARRQANLAAGQAKDEALKKVDETRAELEAAQERAKQQLSSDISKVKESADTQFSQVGTEVTSVKTDVASTKSQLEKTVADLKHATGEIDGHSVLIATNGKELAALQALGERNYVQFTIAKAKQPQKVGDVSILLKHTDPKRLRYTIELTADDKTVEKKDRVANEPLQFMTSKAKQPYEIVVNDVKKDTIVGYLSIPKVLNTRN